MVTLFIERAQQKEELQFSGSITELAKKFSVNLTTVVIVKNGEVVTEEEPCGEDDEIKFLSVISGG